MANSDFLPIISTNEVWKDNDKETCLTDYLDNIGDNLGLTPTMTTGDGGSALDYSDDIGYIAEVKGVDELVSGVSFMMVPHVTSTTFSPTLNVNGLGARQIRQKLSTNSAATVSGSSEGWLIENKPVRVTYDKLSDDIGYWVVDFTRPDAKNLYGTVSVENGGTGKETIGEARVEFGLGGVNEDGTGVLSVANGGTGCATEAELKGFIQSFGVSGADGIIPISAGGTGANNAEEALEKLNAVSKSDVIPVKNGGTGAVTAEGARSNLGVTAAVIGQIIMYAGTIAPEGWLLCDGSMVYKTAYSDLYSVIGDTYKPDDAPNGVNSQVKFYLPNLCGRVPVGAGTGKDDNNLSKTFSLGKVGGEYEHKLTVAQMPSHTHTGNTNTDGAHEHVVSIPYAARSASGTAVNSPYKESDTTTDSWARCRTTGSSHKHAFTTNVTGSGAAHNVMQPYLPVNYIIYAGEVSLYYPEEL